MTKKSPQEAGIEAAPRRHKDIVDREIVRDKRLSLRALGVAVRLLSNAPGYRMTSLDLARERPEGRDAVRAALNELEAAGYLNRQVTQLENGQWVTRQVITDVLTPEPENPSSVPTPGKPIAGTSEFGMPGVQRRKSNSSDNSTRKSTTTTEGQELAWPSQIEEERRVVVAGWMEGLDREQQQQVLDEFSGAMASGKPPDKPLSWLRGLANKAQRGEFVPDRCQQVVQARARQASEALRREQQEARAKAKAEAKAKLQEKLDGLSDAQVLALELPEGLSIGDVQAWLANGRPACNGVAAALRHALGEAAA